MVTIVLVKTFFAMLAAAAGIGCCLIAIRSRRVVLAETPRCVYMYSYGFVMIVVGPAQPVDGGGQIDDVIHASLSQRCAKRDALLPLSVLML